jgi:hypothetical protein
MDEAGMDVVVLQLRAFSHSPLEWDPVHPSWREGFRTAL